MGELLDRHFQRKLLRDLADLYPQSADLKRSYGDQGDNRLLVNLAYLHEHGLIDFKWTKYSDGRIALHTATATARGLDFLADDGGLGAILGVVTVRLHDDTIRKLLIEKIEKADGDSTIKGLMIAKVKELPSEALGSVAMTGLGAALDQTPHLFTLLRTILGI
ncbi:hypothetical protein [Mesorhizobium sp.]|uniref:hypothetical protein n=1 Tax=Mesorhizobium sp. TaxID=1871066 RepID=UPI000FE849C3|nr:hypothetical protein [Mesorhizobium sp.]RWK12160.1 MAG: hypothetical protein EOR39_05100 [Mesorhizobium sp.]